MNQKNYQQLLVATFKINATKHIGGREEGKNGFMINKT